MKQLKFLFKCLSCSVIMVQWSAFSSSKKQDSLIPIQLEWSVDTAAKNQVLKPRLMHNSSPVLIKSLVVQGNALDGLAAYDQSNGKKVWSFNVPSGVASPIVAHKGNLYFGGADGFFYSLQADNGHLNWKFWTGSENAGKPLIQGDLLYWTANNQKLYSLNLKGKLQWIYSGPSLSKDFFVRGRPRPAIYKNWIYIGFYQGSLVALNKKTGKVKWKKTKLSSLPIRQDLEISTNQLLVPVFDSYLFSLNPLNGEIRWKVKGGSSVSLEGKTRIYQWDQEKLMALRKRDANIIWKKKIKERPLAPVVFKKYLIYGFSSLGKLVFADVNNGNVLGEYKFGKGLASPVSLDLKNNFIYFMSVEGYLHKLSIIFADQDEQSKNHKPSATNHSEPKVENQRR